MKFLSLILLISTSVFADSISGTVTVKGDAPKGVLYIFAKKHNSSMPMPLAVKKIETPKYPVKFTLDESNKMMKSIPFEGPFKVTARVSPSGSATDKSGVEVSTQRPIKIDTNNIKLELP